MASRAFLEEGLMNNNAPDSSTSTSYGLQIKNEELKSEIQALELKLGKAFQITSSTRSELAAVKEAKATLEEELDNARRTIDDLQTQLAKSSDKSTGKPAAMPETDELRGKVSELEAQVSSARRDQLDLRESLVLARQESAKQEAQASVYMSRAMGLEDELSVCKAAKDELEKLFVKTGLARDEGSGFRELPISKSSDTSAGKDKALAAVRETVRNLQAELVSSEERCHALNKELDYIRLSSTELETTLHTVQAAKSLIEDEATILRAKVSELEEALVRKGVALSSCEHANGVLGTQLAELRLGKPTRKGPSLEDVNSTRNATGSSTSNEELKNEIQALELRLGKAFQITSSTRSELVAVKEAKATLEEELDNARRTIDDLQAQLAKSSDKSTGKPAAMPETDELRGKVSELEAQVSSARRDQLDLRESLVLARQESAKQEAQASVYMSRAMGLEDELSVCKAAKDELEEKLVVAKESLSSLSTLERQAAEEVIALKREVSELSEMSVKKNKSLDALSETVKELQSELASSSTLERQAAKEVIVLSRQVSERSETLRKLQAELASSEERCRALERDLDSVRRLSMELETKLHTVQAAKKPFEDEATLLRAKVCELEEALVRKGVALSSCEHANGVLGTQLAELRLGKSAMRATIAEANENSARIQMESTTLRNTVNELRAELVKAQEESVRLQEQLVHIDREHADNISKSLQEFEQEMKTVESRLVLEAMEAQERCRDIERKWLEAESLLVAEKLSRDSQIHALQDQIQTQLDTGLAASGRFQQQVEELEQQMSTSHVLNLALEGRLLEMTTMKEALDSKLMQAGQDCEDLRKQCMAWEESVVQLTTDRACAEERIAELARQVSDASEEAERLRGDNCRLDDDVSRLGSELAELRAAVQAEVVQKTQVLVESVTELRAVRERLENQMMEEVERNEKLMQELSSCRLVEGQLKELKQQMSTSHVLNVDLEERLLEMTTMKEDLELKLMQAGRDCEDLREKCMATEEFFEETKMKLSWVEERYVAVASQLTDEISAHDLLKGRLASAMTDLASQQTAFAQATSDFQERQKNSFQRCQDYANRADVAYKKVSELETMVAGAHRENDRLGTSLNEATAQVSRLGSELAELRAAVQAEVVHKTQVLVESVTELRAVRERLENQLMEEVERNEKLMQELSSCRLVEGQLKELKQQMSTSHVLNVDLEERLLEMTTMKEALDSKLMQAGQDCEDLRKQCMAWEESAVQLTTDRERAEERISELARQLCDASEEVERLRGDNCRLDDDVSRLGSELAELRAAVQAEVVQKTQVLVESVTELRAVRERLENQMMEEVERNEKLMQELSSSKQSEFESAASLLALGREMLELEETSNEIKADLKNQLAAAQADVSQLKADLDRSKGTEEQLSSQLSLVRQAKNAMEKSLAASLRRNYSLDIVFSRITQGAISDDDKELLAVVRNSLNGRLDTLENLQLSTNSSSVVSTALKEVLVDALSKGDELQEKLTDTLAALDRAHCDSSRMCDEKAVVDAQLVEWKSAIEDLTRLNEHMAQKSVSDDVRIADMLESKKSIELEMASLKEQLNNVRATAEKLENDYHDRISDWQQRYGAIEQQLSNCVTQLADSTFHVQELEYGINSTELSLREALAQLETEASSRLQLEEEYRMLESKSSREFSTANDRYAELTRQYEGMKSTLQSELQSTIENADMLQDAAKRATEICAEKASQLQEALTSVASLQSLLELHLKDLADTSRKNEQLECQLTELTAGCELLSTELVELRMQRVELGGTPAELIASIMDSCILHIELRSSSENCVKTETTLSIAQSDLEMTTCELQEATHKIDVLTTQLDAAVQERLSLVKEREDIYVLCATLQSKVADSEDEQQKCKLKLNELSTENTSLELQLQRATESIDGLTTDCVGSTVELLVRCSMLSTEREAVQERLNEIISELEALTAAKAEVDSELADARSAVDQLQMAFGWSEASGAALMAELLQNKTDWDSQRGMLNEDYRAVHGLLHESHSQIEQLRRDLADAQEIKMNVQGQYDNLEQALLTVKRERQAQQACLEAEIKHIRNDLELTASELVKMITERCVLDVGMICNNSRFEEEISVLKASHEVATEIAETKFMEVSQLLNATKQSLDTYISERNELLAAKSTLEALLEDRENQLKTAKDELEAVLRTAQEQQQQQASFALAMLVIQNIAMEDERGRHAQQTAVLLEACQNHIINVTSTHDADSMARNAIIQSLEHQLEEMTAIVEEKSQLVVAITEKNNLQTQLTDGLSTQLIELSERYVKDTEDLTLSNLELFESCEMGREDACSRQNVLAEALLNSKTELSENVEKLRLVGVEHDTECVVSTVDWILRCTPLQNALDESQTELRQTREALTLLTRRNTNLQEEKKIADLTASQLRESLRIHAEKLIMVDEDKSASVMRWEESFKALGRQSALQNTEYVTKIEGLRQEILDLDSSWSMKFEGLQRQGESEVFSLEVRLADLSRHLERSLMSLEEKSVILMDVIAKKAANHKSYEVLREKCTDLEKQVADMSDTTHSLNRELQVKNNEMAETWEQLVGTQTHVTTLYDSTRSLNKQLQKKNDEMIEMQLVLESVQSQLSELSRDNNDLLAANGSLRDEVECLSIYKARVEEAEPKLAESNRLLEDCRDANDALESEIQECRTSIAKVSDENVALMSRLEVLQHEHTTASEQLQDVIAKVGSFFSNRAREVEIRKLESITDEDTDHSSISVRAFPDIGQGGHCSSVSLVEALIDLSVSLDKDLFNTSKELKDTHKLLESTKKCLQDVTSEYSSFRLRTDQAMVDITATSQMELQASGDRCADLQRRLTDMRESLNVLDGSFRLRVASLEECKSELSSTRARLDEQSSKCIELTKCNGELSERVSFLSSCEREMAMLETLVYKLEGQLTEANARLELSVPRVELEDVHQQLAHLKCTLDDTVQALTRMSDCEDELIAARKKLAVSKEEYLELENRCDELTYKLTTYQKNNDTLKNQLKNRDAQLSSSAKDLASVKSKLEELVSQNARSPAQSASFSDGSVDVDDFERRFEGLRVSKMERLMSRLSPAEQHEPDTMCSELKDMQNMVFRLQQQNKVLEEELSAARRQDVLREDVIVQIEAAGGDRIAKMQAEMHSTGTAKAGTGQVKELEAKIVALTRELRQLQEALDDSETKCIGLEAELSAMRMRSKEKEKSGEEMKKNTSF